MHTVSVHDISLAFGDRDILQNLSFTLTSVSRVALAGANGSGKTTLMKVLSGLQQSDSGQLQISRGCRITYLPQAAYVAGSKSVYDEAETAFHRFIPLLKRREEIEHQLASCSPDAPPPASLVNELDLLHQQLSESAYYDRERHIYRILTGLGFTLQDLKRKCSEFSGGWNMRIGLAKILLSSPDLMLLDEPTNYLDIDARIWLAGFLKDFPGGVMLVSHDRQFLDDTADEIWSLHQGELSRFTGSYSDFEAWRRLETEKLVQAYHQQQREIERIEQFIRRFRYKASKASQVQSRITYLEKLKRIEIPPYLKRMQVRFPDPPRTGDEVMHLRGLGKSYGTLEVFSDLDLFIRRGDRIAVTGRNGAGKTTLIRIIAGMDQQFTGFRIPGTDTVIGYFQQDIDQILQGSRSVYDEVRSNVPESAAPMVRGALGSFLFHGDDVFKPLSVLSGGEKTRVQLLKLLLNGCTMLVLDEPTNHLDLMSKEVLLDALKQYRGTLVYVSHDQAFIKELSEKILYFSHEPPKLYDGDYDYFLWKIRKEEEENGKEDAVPSVSRQNAGKTQSQHREQKRQRNRIRYLESEEQRIMEDIETAEQEVQQLHHLMSQPEQYLNGDAMKQYQQRLEQFERKQEELTEQWDALHSELSSYKEAGP